MRDFFKISKIVSCNVLGEVKKIERGGERSPKIHFFIMQVLYKKCTYSQNQCS
jgi:hypothetical protein